VKLRGQPAERKPNAEQSKGECVPFLIVANEINP
jgi:hypothetical protein